MPKQTDASPMLSSTSIALLVRLKRTQQSFREKSTAELLMASS